MSTCNARIPHTHPLHFSHVFILTIFTIHHTVTLSHQAQSSTVLHFTNPFHYRLPISLLTELHSRTLDCFFDLHLHWFSALVFCLFVNFVLVRRYCKADDFTHTKGQTPMHNNVDVKAEDMHFAGHTDIAW